MRFGAPRLARSIKERDEIRKYVVDKRLVKTRQIGRKPASTIRHLPALQDSFQCASMSGRENIRCACFGPWYYALYNSASAVRTFCRDWLVKWAALFV